MPKTTSQYRKTFDENIAILLDELKLAIRWNRPSILLTVHRSIPSQAKAEAALERLVTALGQVVVRVAVSPESPNVAETILRAPARGRSVFFVSNLERGGGPDGMEAYRALNLFREHFVENQIRAVFWLTVGEALALPHHATDFWAFRHRVVEFSSPHVSKKPGLPAGVMLWHTHAAHETPPELRDKIAGREQLLKDLPAGPESLSTRAELHYTLGYLHWALGDAARASHALDSGLKLADQAGLQPLRNWMANGAAVIDYESGEFQQALDALNSLTAGSPDDALLLINLAVALSALGRNSEAVTQGRRGLKLAPSDPRLWGALGYVYLAMGKQAEALQSFRQAVELAPAGGLALASLAACYFVMGQTDEAQVQIKLACGDAGRAQALCPAYEAAILGQPERAAALLRGALESQQLCAADVRRDPVLHFVLEPAALNSAL